MTFYSNLNNSHLLTSLWSTSKQFWWYLFSSTNNSIYWFFGFALTIEHWFLLFSWILQTHFWKTRCHFNINVRPLDITCVNQNSVSWLGIAAELVKHLDLRLLVMLVRQSHFSPSIYIFSLLCQPSFLSHIPLSSTNSHFSLLYPPVSLSSVRPTSINLSCHWI